MACRMGKSHPVNKCALGLLWPSSVLSLLSALYLLFDEISWSPGRPGTHSIAKGLNSFFEFLIFLPPCLYFPSWDDRQARACFSVPVSFEIPIWHGAEGFGNGYAKGL